MSTAKLLCQLQASVCCWPRPVTWLLGQLLPSGLGSASGAREVGGVGGVGGGGWKAGEGRRVCLLLLFALQ